MRSRIELQQNIEYVAALDLTTYIAVIQPSHDQQKKTTSESVYCSSPTVGLSTPSLVKTTKNQNPSFAPRQCDSAYIQARERMQRASWQCASDLSLRGTSQLLSCVVFSLLGTCR